MLKSIKNYDYEIIKENETSFFQKTLRNLQRIFSDNPDLFFIDRKTRQKMESSIYQYNPDLIINMLNIPCSKL